MIAVIPWFLFYLDLLLRGKDEEEPEDSDSGHTMVSVLPGPPVERQGRLLARGQ